MNVDEVNNVDGEEKGMGVEPEPMAAWVLPVILGAMILMGLIAVASQT